MPTWEESEYFPAKNPHVGRCKTAVEKRIEAASRAFYVHKAALVSRDLPFSVRLENYRKFIVPVLLFSCECWCSGYATFRKILTWERHCLRRMFRLAKHPDETFVEYRKRHTRQVLIHCKSMGSLDWSAKALVVLWQNSWTR